MTDRDAWLDLTREAAIDPEQRICDPHHHFWHYPTSRYLVDEFTRDLSGGHRILKTVFVECVQFYDEDAPVEMRPVGETAAVERMAQEAGQQPGTGLAAGIVGFADLALGDCVRSVLEAHIEASPRFRGIRHATAWHASDLIHNAHTKPAENLMASGDFRLGLRQLESLGLSFDAWLYHTQLQELTDLAHAMPGLTIVLNHMAGPLGIGPYDARRAEEFEVWKSRLQDLSRCENVAVKLGGRTMKSSGFDWSKRSKPPASEDLAVATAPYFDTCIELFGPSRCMFESNFPVDKAGCSYTVLWNAFKRVASGYTPSERNLLFHDTAARIYRLDS